MQVLVIGIGRFGSAVALELERLGHEVLAVDVDQKAVDAIADGVTHAVCADATQPDTLRDLGAADFDGAVIGMGVSEHASILCTVQLKRLGVPLVLVKADTAIQGEILRMVGADRVVYPELETGTRTAQNLTIPRALDYFDVGPGWGIARFPGIHFAGRTLVELDLPNRFGVTPVFLRRGDQIQVNPPPTAHVDAGHELTVAGADPNLARLGAACAADTVR